jgi:hypothetical protein
MVAPRWRHPALIPGLVDRREQRFADAPSSYDPELRSVDAVLSMGSPVTRFYGTEKLRIDARAVDLSRVSNGGIPVLDSHNQSSITNALGKISRAWFADHGGERALMGTLTFNATAQGRRAQGMIRRNEVTSVSVGYIVDEWEITDEDGRVIDQDHVRWDDVNLNFEATKWRLLEASLVCVPADSLASIRSLGGSERHADRIARMLTRERMHARQMAQSRLQALYDD